MRATRQSVAVFLWSLSVLLCPFVLSTMVAAAGDIDEDAEVQLRGDSGGDVMEMDLDANGDHVIPEIGEFLEVDADPADPGADADPDSGSKSLRQLVEDMSARIDALEKSALGGPDDLGGLEGDLGGLDGLQNGPPKSGSSKVSSVALLETTGAAACSKSYQIKYKGNGEAKGKCLVVKNNGAGTENPPVTFGPCPNDSKDVQSGSWIFSQNSEKQTESVTRWFNGHGNCNNDMWPVESRTDLDQCVPGKGVTCWGYTKAGWCAGGRMSATYIKNFGATGFNNPAGNCVECGAKGGKTNIGKIIWVKDGLEKAFAEEQTGRCLDRPAKLWKIGKCSSAKEFRISSSSVLEKHQFGPTDSEKCASVGFLKISAWNTGVDTLYHCEQTLGDSEVFQWEVIS